MQSLALPSFETLSLTTDNTLSEQGGALANGQYIFLSKVGGTFDNPSLGDERISYSVLLPGFTGTIFGKQNDSRIESYRDKDDHLLFNLLRGGRDDAIASLHSEFVFWTWILRLTGFMMMWVGLGLLFGWIVTLANILPFFGSMTGFLVSFATLITAIVLSLTTIIVSMIVHSLIAVVVAVVISIMVLIFFARKMKNDTPAQIPPSDSQPIQSVPSIMPVTPIVPTV
jgi:hypothetical protein